MPAQQQQGPARVFMMMDITQITCKLESNGKRVCPNSKPFSDLMISISQKGMLIPVYINNRREVVFGHYRLLAAAELGHRAVPIRFAEDPKKIDLAKED